jgi:single-stranded DNA-binding protein
MSSPIYIAGRLVGNPVFSETAKGKSMAKLLLETEIVREVKQNEFCAETHPLPITLFSWVADQARALRNGTSVTIAARLRRQPIHTAHGRSPTRCPAHRGGPAFSAGD